MPLFVLEYDVSRYDFAHLSLVLRVLHEQLNFLISLLNPLFVGFVDPLASFFEELYQPVLLEVKLNMSDFHGLVWSLFEVIRLIISKNL